jgi:hypothetical protein
MTKPTGGPAYPVSAEFFSDGSMMTPQQWGATLRDTFAIAALQSPAIPVGLCSSERAAWYYAEADAMLLEREK